MNQEMQREQVAAETSLGYLEQERVALEKHIECLKTQNDKLSYELIKFNDADDDCIQMLDRKGRVRQLVDRMQEE